MGPTPRCVAARCSGVTLTAEQVIAAAAIVSAVVAAGVKGLWVFGWVYQALQKQLAEMTRDRDFWRDVALKSMGHTDKALDATALALEKPSGDG